MCEAIHVIAGTHRQLDNEILARRFRGEVAVTVRGAESTTWEGFCREISAACQFPYYFNHSTGSLQECLRDCSEGYPEADITIGVRDAHLVLTDEDEEFSSMVSLFWDYLTGSQDGTRRSLLLQVSQLSQIQRWERALEAEKLPGQFVAAELAAERKPNALY